MRAKVASAPQETRTSVKRKPHPLEDNATQFSVLALEPSARLLILASLVQVRVACTARLAVRLLVSQASSKFCLSPAQKQAWHVRAEARSSPPASLPKPANSPRKCCASLPIHSSILQASCRTVSVCCTILLPLLPIMPSMQVRGPNAGKPGKGPGPGTSVRMQTDAITDFSHATHAACKHQKT